MLAVGVLGGIGAMAAPAIADPGEHKITDEVTPYENAMTDIFVGYNQDPLNIDVCYDSSLATGWGEIITAGLRDWNDATSQVRFRSLRPVLKEDAQPANCDLRFSGGKTGGIEGSADARAETNGGLTLRGHNDKTGEFVPTLSFSRNTVQLNDTMETMSDLNDPAVVLANEGTVVHELGHVLSLYDAEDRNSIMFHTHQDSIRLPQPVDVAALALIYDNIGVTVPAAAPLENPAPDVILLDAPATVPVTSTGPAPVQLGTLGNYRWLSAGDNAPNDPKASADALSAYSDATTRETTSTDSIASLDDRVLEAGVYESESIALDGTVTLKGDADAVFILRSASTVKFGSGAEVKLAGGVTADHVIWIAGTQAEIHFGVALSGTLIANDRVRLSTAATVDGHVVSLNERIHLRSTVDGVQESAILAG